LNFLKKLIVTITTNNFYLKFKGNNEELFGLFFILTDGQAKSAQQLISMVLPFHPYIFHGQGHGYGNQNMIFKSVQPHCIMLLCDCTLRV
jgi:hypothetical protein